VVTPAPAPTPAQPQARTITPQPVPAPAPAPPPGIVVQEAPKLQLPAEAEREPIKVGLLLPLSGEPDRARIGRGMLDAALLALYDVAGERLELLPRDTGGTVAGAEQAARDALQEGAQLLLGPLLRNSVTAAAPLARQRGVPVIAFSSDRTVAGNGVYLLSFTPEQEVARVVDFSIARGLRRFAALVPQDAYGRTVLEAFRTQVLTSGGEIVSVDFYPPGGDGAAEAVKNLANFDARRQALLDRRRELEDLGTPAAQEELAALAKLDTIGEVALDAVLLPEGGAALSAVAPLLPYYDIDLNRIRLIGTGRWDDAAVGKEPSMIGGWFAGADRTAVNSFRARFRAHYGREPARLASLAYDATAIAAVLAERPEGADFSHETLISDSGFVGADGLFRFRSDGLAQRGLAVLEIRRDSFRVVDPAPRDFKNLRY